MLFWSNNSSAPRSDASRAARARSNRSVRSRAKSTRCSQSTAAEAPREAIFMFIMITQALAECQVMINDDHLECTSDQLAFVDGLVDVTRRGAVTDPVQLPAER